MRGNTQSATHWRLAVVVLAAAALAACDDSPRGGGGGGPVGPGPNNPAPGPGPADGGTGGQDTAGGGQEGGEGPSEGTPTGENPTPGCYARDDAGLTPVDMQGLNLAPFPGASMPGEPCEVDSDCMYGLCSANSLITQGRFKICVKRCGGCGEKSPACSWDDDPFTTYTCVIGSFGGQNQSHCAAQCSDVGECTAIHPDYTTCNTENAARRYCGSRD